MAQLDEDMLAGIKTARERKLSNAERVAHLRLRAAACR